MGDKAGAEERRDMKEHYSLNTKFGAADELFGAIMTLDKKRVKELKAHGITLTENVRNVLENGHGKKQNMSDPAAELYFHFFRELKETPVMELAEELKLLRAETSKPLYYLETLWFWGNKRRFVPEIFKAVLDSFDQKQMSKKRTMREIIDENALGCLPVCEKNGWLKDPKTRDGLIEYANEIGGTECSAWLLDFKNRTADLAAEQARAEKKTLRELNAAPDSVSEMKKRWRFKRLSDGTLEISCCKITRAEIAVPERIGKETVTAIGRGAFSADKYFAPRTPREILEFRGNDLKSVILPESVTSIGEGAFGYCTSLTEVYIPEGVKEISENAFYASQNVTAIVARGSYAEKYCSINGVKFKYKDGM